MVDSDSGTRGALEDTVARLRTQINDPKTPAYVVTLATRELRLTVAQLQSEIRRSTSEPSEPAEVPVRTPRRPSQRRSM